MKGSKLIEPWVCYRGYFYRSKKTVDNPNTTRVQVWDRNGRTIVTDTDEDDAEQVINEELTRWLLKSW